FGTEAHQFFERFNNRLANRVAGTYGVSTEQFRDPLGFVGPPRTTGSIGADVLYACWRSTNTSALYDLTTFSVVGRPIGATRHPLFIDRFGVRAQEIFVRQR